MMLRIDGSNKDSSLWGDPEGMIAEGVHIELNLVLWFAKSWEISEHILPREMIY